MINGMNINDSIHGLIRLTEYEKKILSSLEFNRLHDVYQNSTVYLTFPCNRTKRFEHSIGCMYLCFEMFYHSCLNTSEENLKIFFSEIGESIKSFYQNIDADKIAKIASSSIIKEKSDLIINEEVSSALDKELCELYYHILDKIGEDLIPHNISIQYGLIYLLLVQSIRIAALLHDIGHPPFSHIVESALNKINDEIHNAPDKFVGEKTEEFTRNINKLKGIHEQLHEAMGDQIANDIMKQLVTDNTGGKFDACGRDSLFEQLLQQCVTSILRETGGFKVLHRVIDSTLDGDRLDYVARDYRNSGINAGDLEYKRIISGMKLACVESVDGKSLRFLVPVKAINTVENFLKRRFNLYKDVINHHRVIKTDTLLEDVVYKLSIKYLKNHDDEQENPDSEVSIPDNISGLWVSLDNINIEGRRSLLTQWNDSWLMVVLKKIYYKQYFDLDNVDSDEYVLAQELTELLRNEKQYYSFIKRREDVAIIGNEIKAVLEKRDKLSDKIKELNKSTHEEQVEKDEIRIPASSQKVFLELMTLDPSKILSFVYKNIAAFMYSERKFENDICDICQSVCRDNFVDAKPVFKKLKDGISLDDRYIWFYSDDDIYALSELSDIQKVLGIESDSAPLFYLYVVPNKKIDIKTKKIEVLKEIGTGLGSKIAKILESALEVLN